MSHLAKFHKHFVNFRNCTSNSWGNSCQRRASKFSNYYIYTLFTTQLAGSQFAAGDAEEEEDREGAGPHATPPTARAPPPARLREAVGLRHSWRHS